jgi:phosphatidate cytidylyltransferase
MIRTRLLIGTTLALLAAALLYLDAFLAPWYPLLGGTVLAVLWRAAYELRQLLEPTHRPPYFLLGFGLSLCWAANWWPLIAAAWLPPSRFSPPTVWSAVLFAYCLTFVLAFFWEMARYPYAGAALPRLAVTTLILTYLGLLGSCFLQLRFLPPSREGPAAIAWLVAAIAVPKANDIAAYFTGTFLGRTPMAPHLSPKKTWEGAAGGLAGGVAAAWLITLWQPSLFPDGLAEAVLFGLLVGGAGMLGDLAESLWKRDCHAKDAAALLPGFGGLLDVIDSLLFAAPVVYLWSQLRL